MNSEVHPPEAKLSGVYDLAIVLHGRGAEQAMPPFMSGAQRLYLRESAPLMESHGDEDEHPAEMLALARHWPGCRLVVVCYTGRRARDVSRFARKCGIDACWWSVAHSPFTE